MVMALALASGVHGSVFKDWDNGGLGGFMYARPKATTLSGTVLLPAFYVQPPPVPIFSGSVVLDLGWTDNYLTQESPPASGSVTIEYDLDGQQAVSGYISGPPFTFTLDTTKIPDGTHALSVRIVDSTGATWPASRMRGLGQQIIVRNSGAVNGAQRIPVPGFFYNSHHLPSTVDWVTYPGSPQHNTVHPYPYQFVAPSNSASLRSVYSWYIEALTEARITLYEGNPEFATTQQGGVAVQYFNPEAASTLEGSIPFVEHHYNFDGGRDDNRVDPYSSVVAAPDGSGWVGVELSGRVFKMNNDGSVVTLAGLRPLRSALQYDYVDLNVSPAQIAAKSQSVGTGMAPGTYGSPNDLVFDPRNSNLIYLADTIHHAIWKVDLSQSNPTYTLYAGKPDQAGYVNGPALNAQFNEPTSLIMAPDGTMYIADFNNCAIRKISPDGSTVTTLVGLAAGQPAPSMVQVATSRDTYSPPTPVSFAAAMTPYPQVIRFDSSGNIVEGETVSTVVRLINLSNQTVSRIVAYNAGDAGRTWIWLDVDTAGAIGPKDDILMTQAQGSPGNLNLFRFSEDGSYGINPMVDYGDNGPIPDGPANAGFVVDQTGHYPWFVAISKTEGRFIAMGFANVGVSSWRILQPSDPPAINGNFVQIYYNGLILMQNGTVPGFPWGARPSFESLQGVYGSGHLGTSVCPTFDDLMVRYPDDASLTAYIQAGMCGSVPRPEITGNDLRDLIYYIRRSSLQGGSLSPVSPGAWATDTTPPVISNVTATFTSATSLTVSWTTDKRSIGFVAWGSSSDYNGYSPIEGGYGTSHSVTLSGVTQVQTLHYGVVAKSEAGFQSNTNDQTINNPNGSAPSLPNPPLDVTATGGDGQVVLTWDPVFNAASYNLYWTSTSGDPKSSGNKITGVTSPYTFTGTNGVTYTFALTTLNSAGESGESTPLVSATPNRVLPPAATPTISPNGGSNLTAPQAVALACATPGAQIYFTTDGSNPAQGGSDSTLYTGPIALSGYTILNARAYAAGNSPSAIAGPAVFTFANAPNTTATPTITPPGGSFSGSVSVTLQDASPSAFIYYTLDGSPPTTNSPLYNGPITITQNTTLRAFARSGSLNPSGIATAVFSSGSSGGGLSAIDPGLIPSYASLNAPLTIANYNPGVSVSFNWSFVPTANAPYQSGLGDSAPNTSASASFKSGTQTQNLSSYGLTAGTYQVTVQAVDNANSANTSAPVTKTITLLAMVETNFSAVRVYPNPWRKDKHESHPITFDQMPIGATVKLFTVSGHEVKTLHPALDSVTWDLTNDSGDKVASGIYIYLITVGDSGAYGGSGEKLRGKVAVIR